MWSSPQESKRSADFVGAAGRCEGVRYMGGKYRVARHIAANINRLRLQGKDEYVEPFVGGAAVASRVAPAFTRVRLSDVVPDLVLMWQAAIAGWVPPAEVPEKLYQELRNADPSALRGFVGFGCSFGGKFFGGYARQRIAGGQVATETTLAPSASRTVVKQAAAMRHASVELVDYRNLRVGRGCVVYADPPYEGVADYGAAGPFDSVEFWDVAAGWVGDGASVLVSEHSAPPGWVQVWSGDLPLYLRGTEQTPSGRTERLWADPRTVDRLH
jgi:DNA adenine methylase